MGSHVRISSHSSEHGLRHAPLLEIPLSIRIEWWIDKPLLEEVEKEHMNFMNFMTFMEVLNRMVQSSTSYHWRRSKRLQEKKRTQEFLNYKP